MKTVKENRGSGLQFARVVLAILIAVILISTSGIKAQNDQDISISGTYLGLFNNFDQEGTDDDVIADRRQFDFAANINFEWQIRENIVGIFQLQGSPGEGSLGFPGAPVEITDLNINFIFDEYDATVTIGSFDTPFGMQTGSLSNNANSFGNPMLMNSLFYSAFAGAPMGTLNTLGAMGNYSGEYFDISAAITNGTDESAANPDQGFEVSGTAVGKIPLEEREARVALSYIYSDDLSDEAATGTESDFSGWMAEGLFEFMPQAHIKGYYGMLDYDVNVSELKSGLDIWMLEGKFGQNRWHIAARISAWMPEDDNGDEEGISPAIPTPGLAVDADDFYIVRDQKVSRIQLGAGFMIDEDLALKGEFFIDNYDKNTEDVSTDVQGFIIALNGRF